MSGQSGTGPPAAPPDPAGSKERQSPGPRPPCGVELQPPCSSARADEKRQIPNIAAPETRVTPQDQSAVAAGAQHGAETVRENAVQGTFHLLAVLLAFIMGNLFAVHAENQKDLRTELAALEAIQWEVQRGDVRLGELGRTRVKPCLVAWADRPVETKVWQNLSTQESVLLLQDIQMRPNRSRAGDAQAATGSGTTVDPAKSARTGVALLAEIRSTYEDVAVAPELTAAITNAQSCARFMARLTAELKRLDNDLQQTIDELDGRYKRGQWVYSQPLWIYLLGLGVIWALYLLRGLFGPWRIPWRPRRTQG